MEKKVSRKSYLITDLNHIKFHKKIETQKSNPLIMGPKL